MTDSAPDSLPLDLAPPARLSDFIALLKPRVMTLVVFTGIVGLAVAPGRLHPVLAAVAVLCIALAAGAAGAINMWYERDLDALMKRTRNRPLPAGRIAPPEALAFGVVLSVLAVALMGLAVGWLAAGLLAAANAFYVFVYTIWLKRRTPQNIVIGGAAGAFPPMIGWAAVTGGVDPAALALFAIIFLWTPPHFWALALFMNSDYEAAGVPMLPAVAGEAETRRQILAYSLILLPVSVLPWALGVGGPLYLAAALGLGAGLIGHGWRVRCAAPGETGPARAMFGYSIFYLAALFAALMAGAALQSLMGAGAA